MVSTCYLAFNRLLGTYSLGHADTGIPDGQGLVLLVRNDVDAEVLAGIKLALVRQGLVTDLVERIRGVRDKFSQEDFLVRVDGVDDQRKKLRDLSLKLESLGHLKVSAMTGRYLPRERGQSTGLKTVSGLAASNKRELVVFLSAEQEKLYSRT